MSVARRLLLLGGLTCALLVGSASVSQAQVPYHCGPFPPHHHHFHHPYHHHAHFHHGVGYYGYRPYVPYYPPVRVYSYYPGPSNYLHFQNRNFSVGFGSW
ncbi:MAG: hypothetical protein SFX18_13605 [Pirellulales bacterium]|nr:hypothetical protein [Pirellulales bacterium]